MRLVALALTLAGPAATDPVDLEWRGDPTCPPDPYRRALAAHLADTAAAPRIRVTVAVRRDAATWTLDLALAAPDGASNRSLAGPSCAAVSSAAAFITALVVDPALSTRAAPPIDPTTTPTDPNPTPPPTTPNDRTTPSPASQSPAPTTDPDPATPNDRNATRPASQPPLAANPATRNATQPASRSPAPATDPNTPRSPAPRRLRGLLRLAGGLEALGMPRVGPQLSPTLGLLGPRWRVELGALYRAPTRVATHVDPPAGGAIRLWTLGLRGCGVLHPRRPRTDPPRLDVPLCLGLEAGQAIGRGYGLATTQAARLPWLAVTAGAAVAWSPRPWIALWTGLDLAVPLVPGRFVVVDQGEVHRLAAPSLRASLGLEARF